MGNSRQAKFWTNKTISFDELCKRLKTPIRTTETAGEYPKLPKAERDAIKDKGGFVAGHLRDNRRSSGNVVFRSALVYDLDSITPEFLQNMAKHIPNSAVYYTTHSHTVDKPRARIFIPATRDMTPDEFVAVSRYYARDKGFIDMLDPCSFSPHQLMYWPTCPADGEYICEVLNGPWLDPDDVLKDRPFWKDCSLLPTTPKESRVFDKSGHKQKNPLEKPGAVGAFCRAYTIQKAIETFLPDVYAPSVVPGRYDYIPGEGAAGLVIYEDRFAYSHHATDPAGGRLCNSFDLVRIHRFGDVEEKEAFKLMTDFATEDSAVKEQLAAMKFGGGKEEWQAELKFSPKTGVLENSVWNLNLIMANDPDFGGFAYNELANRVQITGKLPWERPEGNIFWRDADTAQLKSMIDIRYGEFSTRNFDVSFLKTVDDRHFHPIREYLDSLPEWDGVKRVEDLFIKYLQAEDTKYVKTVTRKTFAAAVARIYKPGEKFDCVPVLDGMQGIGKSSIIKDLVSPEYYSESLSLTDMDDKAGAEKLQGFWVVEIGELAGMKKADIEKVKSFLSTADDKYRPSYGKTVESHPRQCVIIGTVNGERGYLRDITGNRRFWIIKLNQREQKRRWHFTQEFKDQFWAEAKKLWLSGEPLYLEGDMLEEAEKHQRNAMETDERVGMVEAYLNTPLPDNWDTYDLYRRRSYLSGDITAQKGTQMRKTVTNAEIWCECFGKNLSDLKARDSYAIAAIMTQIEGWERTEERKRIPIYGRQRIYRIT